MMVISVNTLIKNTTTRTDKFPTFHKIKLIYYVNDRNMYKIFIRRLRHPLISRK